MARFESSVVVSSSPHAVFDFLLRPANIALISPPQMGLSFIDAPELLATGTRLEFQVQGFGPPQRIIHEIIEVEAPRRFLERQVKGPLRHWVHEHLVEHESPGQVVVIDRIEFEPPGGLVGLLVTEHKILQSLSAGFDHRHRELKRLLAE
jgi:ligand-binding SRPBCC domain-containing protein